MPLPRATSCFLRPSSPLPFHAQVSHSFPTDPFVSSAAGVCFGRYRPRGPRPLFIARCRRPSDFDAASTILEAGIETSNCCWNRRRARYRFSWARLKSWLGKSSPDALCTGTVAATSAGAGAGAIMLPTLASSTLGAHWESGRAEFEEEAHMDGGPAVVGMTQGTPSGLAARAGCPGRRAQADPRHSVGQVGPARAPPSLRRPGSTAGCKSKGK